MLYMPDVRQTVYCRSSNFYIPATAIPNGDYEWRVRIIDGSWPPQDPPAGASPLIHPAHHWYQGTA